VFKWSPRRACGGNSIRGSRSSGFKILALGCKSSNAITTRTRLWVDSRGGAYLLGGEGDLLLNVASQLLAP